MKVVTVLGTRPEIIRLSLVIKKLDQSCEHVLVFTGQNFDRRLSDIFFQQMGVREPDCHLGVKADSFAGQVGQIMSRCEEVFKEQRPDRLLILGDTNSGLSAFVAKRMGIDVLHMEAGNRCYDDRVPEEVNRRVIDHSSDVLMPYTERSRQNLLREGIPGHRVFVTGNPIFEVIKHYEPAMADCDVLEREGLEPGGYFLVTLHRAENVDLAERLKGLADSLAALSEKYGVPIIVSTHPRTRLRMDQFGIATSGSLIRFPEPYGFFDFITLEKHARCVLSDSGTVQEECAIFKTPVVTLRDVTERPETMECGSNILSGASREDILRCTDLVLAQNPSWQPPPEYVVPNVSDTVVRIALSYHHQTP